MAYENENKDLKYFWHLDSTYYKIESSILASSVAAALHHFTGCTNIVKWTQTGFVFFLCIFSVLCVRWGLLTVNYELLQGFNIYISALKIEFFTLFVIYFIL